MLLKNIVADKLAPQMKVNTEDKFETTDPAKQVILYSQVHLSRRRMVSHSL